MPASPTLAQGQTFYNDTLTNHELDSLVRTHSQSITSPGNALTLTKEVNELRSCNKNLEIRNTNLEKIVGVQGYKLARLTERFDKLLTHLDVDISDDAPDSTKPRRHTKTFSEGNLHALLMNEDKDSHVEPLSPFPLVEVDSRDDTAVGTPSSLLDDNNDDEDEDVFIGRQRGRSNRFIRGSRRVTHKTTASPRLAADTAATTGQIECSSAPPARSLGIITLKLSIRIFINSVLITQLTTILPAKDFYEFSTIRSEVVGRTQEAWDDAVANAATAPVDVSAGKVAEDKGEDVDQDTNAFWASAGIHKAALVQGVEFDIDQGVLSLEETMAAAQSSIAPTKVKWSEKESCGDNWRMWWARNVADGSKEYLEVGFRVDMRKCDEATRQMMARWVD